MKLGFVGCGRVAHSLAIAAEAAGYDVASVSSRNPGSAEALASRLTGCAALSDPQQVVAASDIVFLTVPDAVLGPLAASLHLGRAAAVHCSSRLGAALPPHVPAAALYPLRTFYRREPVDLTGVAFALECEEPGLRAELRRFVAAVNGRPVLVTPGERARLRAAMALARDGVAAILGAAQELFPGVDLAGLGCQGSAEAAAAYGDGSREPAADALHAATAVAATAAGRDGMAGGTDAESVPDAAAVATHLAALAGEPLAARALWRLAQTVHADDQAATDGLGRAPSAALATVLHGKLHRATVTEANVDYVGSITVDADLLRTADIAPGEAVHVLDVDNGERLVTYALAGPPGSGAVCVNGAAARRVSVGDRVIIVTYAQVPFAERASVPPRVVLLDAANRPLAG